MSFSVVGREAQREAVRVVAVCLREGVCCAYGEPRDCDDRGEDDEDEDCGSARKMRASSIARRCECTCGAVLRAGRSGGRLGRNPGAMTAVFLV
jgi:hypothetical protein